MRIEDRGTRTGRSVSTNAAGTRSVNPKQRARNCGRGGELGAHEECGRGVEDKDGGYDGRVLLGRGEAEE